MARVKTDAEFYAQFNRVVAKLVQWQYESRAPLNAYLKKHSIGKWDIDKHPKVFNPRSPFTRRMLLEAYILYCMAALYARERDSKNRNFSLGRCKSIMDQIEYMEKNGPYMKPNSGEEEKSVI